jgi:tRNA threonylcarbamoyladenosine biosynthesis protein TsaB
MRILGLDTATGGCSATLIEGPRVLAARRESMHRGQSERLIPMVLDVLAEAGLAFADLDGFGVTIGPGAFTGLRIGIAAARGFALASGRPAVGITTFACAVGSVRDETIAGRPVLAAVASGRAEIFAQLHDAARRPRGPALNATPQALLERFPAPLVIVGDGWPQDVPLPPGMERIDTGPADAEIVARLAARRLADGGAIEKPRPFYLREADTSTPKRPPPRIRS